MCWYVQSLATLEQGGSISLSSLEVQLETLLECRHIQPTRDRFGAEALALLSGVGISLAAYVITWLDRKGRGFPIYLISQLALCLALCPNTEYTAVSERRILALIKTWTSQIFPSGPGVEAELFLWWHKAQNLICQRNSYNHKQARQKCQELS
uniref:ectopic P granules protein 5 homolog n=1 Tax=Monopterus albus TaxID=43700 RepID=UPI0009B463CC|nr:ectopic P granules protein 5 homolog [Monopterus albus]